MNNEFEVIEYNICYSKSWVIKDNDGEIWFPLSEIFLYLFKIKFNVSQITKRQAKNTIRARVTTPRKKLNNVSKEKQPRDVIVFGNLWCIKNIIRNKVRMAGGPLNRGRDLLVEEFANYWGFKAIGFGMITHRRPNWENYSLYYKIAIAAEENKHTWMQCVECEKYLPHTTNFFKKNNITCEKCLEREFKINSSDACAKIEEMLKKREQN